MGSEGYPAPHPADDLLGQLLIRDLSIEEIGPLTSAKKESRYFVTTDEHCQGLKNLQTHALLLLYFHLHTSENNSG